MDLAKGSAWMRYRLFSKQESDASQLGSMPGKNEPFIPASTRLPEITIRVILLSVILTVLLAAANAYLGLKAGMTISASIPAAVISMAILRFFKNSNLLENNIVQTAASAGEALTAGIIFTVPALIVLHYWNHFAYWQTVTIAALGGTLGVLFSVPLRRVLLADPTLKFPEGTAIGNVLKASAQSGTSVKNLLWGCGVGAVISFCQTGLQVLAGSVQFWTISRGVLFGAGIGFDPALIGAGYIVGINVGLVILLGIILGWVIGIPIIAFYYGLPAGNDASSIALTIWGNYIRYIGVGAMMAGGLAAMVTLSKPMFYGIKASLLSIKELRQGGHILRTEQDIPIHYVLWGLVFLLIPLCACLLFLLAHDVFPFVIHSHIDISIFYTFFIFILGFIIASICAYFAGLVGSSANPLSSLALIALIATALVTSLFLPHSVSMDAMLSQTSSQQSQAMLGPAAFVIVITAFISAIASISNDTLQDLKAGQMVGATPWKQQFMLIIGVLVAALVIPSILQLLFDAYGMAGIFPHPNMDPAQMLAAPQAGLMAAVAEGVFTGNVNWVMMGIGIIIAIACLFLDKILKPKGWRVPVLAVGLGIYLPVETSSCLVIGGILCYLVEKKIHRLSKQKSGEKSEEFLRKGREAGLILACGMVAGASLVGVILAIPFVIAGSTTILSILPAQMTFLPNSLAIVVLIALFWWFERRVCK
jgi:putative OPT family oligopeptide transporter